MEPCRKQKPDLEPIMKILIVEDDRSVAQTLELILSSYNYAVDIAEDGEAGRQMADAFEHDLIILDIFLPKLDGVTLCQQLRGNGLQVPILLLTGQEGAHQKAIALNAGADDYVVKPFDTEELMARVQALLRRGNIAHQPILAWEKLSVDPSTRKVSYDTHSLVLAPKEYAILELFLRNPEKAHGASAILEHAWNSVESPGEETVRVHIKVLRQKLTAVGAPKDLIKTVHRVGYCLNPIYAKMQDRAEATELSPEVPQETAPEPLDQALQQVLAQLNATQAELRQKNQALAQAEQTTLRTQQQLQAIYAEFDQRVAERITDLQRLYDFVPCAYHVLDSGGRYVQVNDVELQMLGYERDEMLGHPLVEFLSAESIPVFQAHFPLEHPQRWIKDLKLTLIRKDGGILPVNLSAIPLPNRLGNHAMSHSIMMMDMEEQTQLILGPYCAQHASK
jgi:PAS domain S-box-containing protein